jgi:hypothetical protein
MQAVASRYTDYAIGRSHIQISAWRLETLTQLFRDVTVPPGKFQHGLQLGYDRFLPSHLQFIIH